MKCGKMEIVGRECYTNKTKKLAGLKWNYNKK